MYNINFESTNTSLTNLTLIEVIQSISEHLASFGYDDQPITISSFDNGNIIEVIRGENSENFEKVSVECFCEDYTISELLEILPYIREV